MPGIGGVDGLFLDMDKTAPLRDNYDIKDQNNVFSHPVSDISPYAYNQWYHRVLPFAFTNGPGPRSITVGEKLTEFNLSMAISDKEHEYTKLDMMVLYDNIVITNDNIVKKVIFEGVSDIKSDEIRDTSSYLTIGTVTVVDSSGQQVWGRSSTPYTYVPLELPPGSIVPIPAAYVSSSVQDEEEPVSEEPPVSGKSLIPLIAGGAAVIVLAAGTIILIAVMRKKRRKSN